MHIRIRRTLFWVAVVIFFAVAFITIRYAQGYVYDFDARRFVRTGAIAVSANTDAKLFVDDEFAGELSLVTHRAGKTRLEPGSHAVRLVRDGWSAWSKEVIVEEGFLTEFGHVLLLPTDDIGIAALRDEASRSLSESLTLADATPLPSPSPRPKGITPTPLPRVDAGDFMLLGTGLFLRDGTASGSFIADGVLGFQADNDRVLWWTQNEVWVYFSRDTSDQPLHKAGDRELLGRWTSRVRGAAWFRDRYHLVIDLGTQGYRVLETDSRGGMNVVRF
ncbi:MAG TPA: hypothetical protein VJ553_05085 [Candidatus Paceibacterota bacterium]|nr:hypothetical protein [Candidatus Paceibacterota bacterium]